MEGSESMGVVNLWVFFDWFFPILLNVTGQGFMYLEIHLEQFIFKNELHLY